MPSTPARHSILMTGATGMVGAVVQARLLRRGHSCAVIARPKGKLSGAERLDGILERFEEAWETTLPRPQIFDGDLNRPLLGLNTAAADWISQHCGTLLHSAASLSFSPASEDRDNEPYRTNLGGTENVLLLAQKLGINNLHHVSTAYVCGMQSGTVYESILDNNQAFANDYENSKLQAELLLHERWRQATAGGQEAEPRQLTVYRPSIVIDPIGLTPVSGDRTIYGAFSMYGLLASRFGLPAEGEWFRNLGFRGGERKNLVDVHWIAEAIETVLENPQHHGRTYHLTAEQGTSIEQLDHVFRLTTEQTLANRPRSKRITPASGIAAEARNEIDKIAAPFVNTFLPYFRDDPSFDRSNIDSVIASTSLRKTPAIGIDELTQMTRSWSAATVALRHQANKARAIKTRSATASSAKMSADKPDSDEVVIVGYEVRLPAGVDDASKFEQLLYRGESAIGPLPKDRLDRELYLHPTPGTPGKTYTEIGGCVAPTPLQDKTEDEIDSLGTFDLTHRQFAQVVAAAMRATTGATTLQESLGIDPTRAGVFVGHSGGTETGGALALATLADSAARFVDESADDTVDQATCQRVRQQVTDSIRQGRPRRQLDGSPDLNAYSAASLAARLIGFQGRREVIDAACSSSLIALHHAATAIQSGRLDIAMVGGATYNNVDNLALFSQTGACSAKGSFPFDSRASGLVSSEGYVAVLVARRSTAESAGMPVLATLHGVGISSDGKGKGLWAPRSEGQQLAMRRALPDQKPLQIDYLECHATSTQVGDATELKSLDALLSANRNGRLPIGSVKSNLGHLLEAAGLVGMVKCLIAMRRGELAPSINFETPTPTFDWDAGKVKVVSSAQNWPASKPRVAAVNAFGIGGLNAHAVFEQETHGPKSSPTKRRQTLSTEPIAIVGRGLVLPGAMNLSELAALLRSGESRLRQPPADRWPRRHGTLIGLPQVETDDGVPHALGGYIEGFRFDAQSYRIPPKVVANANPAQLMLIEAVRQAMDEYDGFTWTLDRQRVSVAIGTMFGGQFSNELQIGLRLPEICRSIELAAADAGVDRVTANRWAQAYRKATLAAYPALLDETGGFTASTLASRIARTFDLMGGAFAVDADEASGSLALLTAAEQLSTGAVDAVICGTAQRSMDLVALEQLYRNHRLARSASPEEVLKDPSRIFPGEGVAIMVLQRLSDARDSGRPIFGVVDGLSESFVADVANSRRRHGQTSLQNDRFAIPKMVSQIGHLGGGQGLVQTIAATIACENHLTSTPVTVSETASDGYQIQYTVSGPEQTSIDTSADSVVQQPTSTTTLIQSVTTPSSVLSICLGSDSPDGLAESLRSIAEHGMDEPLVDTGDKRSPCVAILTGETHSQLQSAAAELLSGPLSRGISGVAVKHAALVRLSDVTGTRIAWTFPGQGSQYAAVPRAFDLDESCGQSIERFDSIMQSRGLHPVGDRLHDPESRLGRDVWWTQAWLLAVGTSLTDFLSFRGLRPDVVLGHSFGECTAAWASGVMSTSQAIDFAKHRSDAVTMHGGPRGELLSVRGEPSHVASVLRCGGNDCTITHHNSPEQTVIAGSPEAISTAKNLLGEAGLASVVIPVPAAFHTPAMQPAREVLSARQSGTTLLPPRCAFLSATQNRYLAEPEEIRANLIDQLITPVGFSGAVQRLVSDGCGLIIEVGPSNVLTRLARASVGSKALCVSADEPGVPIQCITRLIEIASELFSGTAAPVVRNDFTRSSLAPQPPGIPSGSPRLNTAGASSHATITPEPKQFSVVDVTRRGRRGTNGAASDSDVTTPAVEVASDRRTKNGKANGTHAGNDVPKITPIAGRDRVVQHAVAQTVSNLESSPPAAPQTAAKSVPSDRTLEQARSFLFDLVVDLTGYEPEIIDFDADLEAELGVDSIKKAQLIGELVQWGGLNLTTSDIRLAEYQSMSDILALIKREAGTADACSSPHVTQAVETQLPPASLPPESQAPASQAPASQQHANEVEVDPEALRQLMIDLLVDQTGYDEDIIDMEADLESELGIDSIKRAQLLGELEQQFELPPIQQTNLKLSDFPTLNSIHAFIMDQVASRKKKSLLR